MTTNQLSIFGRRDFLTLLAAGTALKAAIP